MSKLSSKKRKSIPTYPGFRPASNPQRQGVNKLHAELSRLVPKDHSLSEAVVLCFRENWLNDRPYDIKEDGRKVTSRGNFTLHTAMALREVARMFGLRTVYESRGRFDGILFHDWTGNKSVPVLLCEWEANDKSTLTDAGEIIKLATPRDELKAADCLLLTYVESRRVPNFVKDAVELWRDSADTAKRSLFLMIVVFEKRSGSKLLKAVRTLRVTATNVELWDDAPYPGSSVEEES